MSGIFPDVWVKLATERPKGETLWARHATPDVTTRLVAGLDAEGERHLLILLRDREPNLEDTQSRGVGVLTRELAIPGHEAGRYLDVTCKDASGHEVFDLIGGELAERLATGAETAAEVVVRVLAKWRRFWGQLPNQMLSREEQLGLFGEIWFLSIWLVPKVGPSEAVMRWRGPNGSRHDFEWEGRSVEVKTSSSTRGRIHRINGLDQLMPPAHGELFFFSLRLREEGGATNSLPMLISLCTAQLDSDSDALGLFELNLNRAGYSHFYENEYAKIKLRVVEEGLFRVEDGFPRLTPEELRVSVPPGLERVDYDINLVGCSHLLVAGNPEAFQDL